MTSIILTGAPGVGKTTIVMDVATRMWQDYDYNYYEKNKNKMLSPQKVAAKIIEIILDVENYKNGDFVEMYNL